eukprot:g646.t1
MENGNGINDVEYSSLPQNEREARENVQRKTRSEKALLEPVENIGTNGIVQIFAWGKGSLDLKSDLPEVDLYIGANRYVVDIIEGDAAAISEATSGSIDEGAGVYGMNWDDEEACSRQFNGSTYCEDCKDVVLGQVTSAYTGLLSSFGQVMADVTRRNFETDYNCQKTMGIVTGIVGIASNIYAIMLFKTTCVDSINDNFPGLESDIALGFGMQALIASTVIKVVDTMAHVIVPTPEERHGDHTKLL